MKKNKVLGRHWKSFLEQVSLLKNLEDRNIVYKLKIRFAWNKKIILRKFCHSTCNPVAIKNIECQGLMNDTAFNEIIID